VAAARSDESIGAESTATAFPVSSAAVLRIPLHQRTPSCNLFSINQNNQELGMDDEILANFFDEWVYILL
jgi:hypothetical protein